MAVDIDVPDFDLLGDLGSSVAQPPPDGTSTAPAASAQPQPPQAATPRPVLRLPSFACTASKVPAALNGRLPAGAAPNGAAPLHLRDLNGAVASNSCGSRQASAAGGSCDGGKECTDAPVGGQQAAGCSSAFRAPRLQPRDEHRAPCVQTVSRPEARQGGERDSAERVGTCAVPTATAHAAAHAADGHPLTSPPLPSPTATGKTAHEAAQRRRLSSKRPDVQPAADDSNAAQTTRQQLDRRRSGASPSHASRSASIAPADVTPPQAPEPCRLSGSAGAQASRRTSSSKKRPQMRRMYTSDDPLDSPSDPEDRALLEADLPPSERTPASIMQREPSGGVEGAAARVHAEPQRSFKRLRKAGGAPQGAFAAAGQTVTPTVAPSSAADPLQPESRAAGSEPPSGSAAGGAGAVLTFDTPLPNSRPRHNPFAKSKRKAAKPVRLVQDAAAPSVSAATLRGVMNSAMSPRPESSSSKEEAWPEASGRTSWGDGTSARAGGGSAARHSMARGAASRHRQQSGQRRGSAPAAGAVAAAPERPQGADRAGGAIDAERAAVIAETRAAAAAAGIDLTGDDDEDDGASLRQDPAQLQWQRRSAGGRPTAKPQQGDGQHPDAQQAGWAPGTGFGDADDAAAPAQEQWPAAEAGPWRQRAGAAGSAWRPDTPDIDGSGSAGGGEPWYMRLPDYLPVGATDSGRDPRNGDTVYVDYLRQFSGEKAPRAARGAGKAAAAARGDAGTGAAVGAAAGHWLTKGGAKVYVDARGKQLSGRAAWSAYSKDTGKKGSRSSGGGGGGVRKRRAKGGGAGRRRKGGWAARGR